MGDLLQQKTTLEDFDLANELGIPHLTIRELEDFISILQASSINQNSYLQDLKSFEDPLLALHDIYAGNIEILASANNSPFKNIAMEYMARAYLLYLDILCRSNEA